MGSRATARGAIALAAAMAMCAPAVAAKDAAKPAVAAPAEAPEIPAELRKLAESLHPRTGVVAIPAAQATLNLGDAYYFLPADEAKRVLVEIWGNPPETVGNVLGMVFEKGATVFDNVWGAVITYEETGHISDEDATGQDYDAVLANMRAGDAKENEARRAAGFPAMTLIGWAQPPSYNRVAKSLIWAREIAAEGAPEHTLNYDVRLLGRTGVLSLNMIAAMPSLASVRDAARTFAEAAKFNPGARYADFNAATDATAGYGLAGLVAGGAAVGLAKKAGLLAVLLKFWKLIALGLGALVLGAWRLLTGRHKDRLDDEDSI